MSVLQKTRHQWREIRRRFSDPKRYVKTDEVSGQLQLSLLQREGCCPQSTVLELGCGCLHLAMPLVQFLDVGNYVGVDPNAWLRRKAFRKEGVKSVMQQRNACFLERDDFDASELSRTFDFGFSHSVLSHVADWQFEQFVSNVSRLLNPGGKILSSIRLADGNAFGSTGSIDAQDSNHKEWQYPGVSWFTMETVEETAEKCGLEVTREPEYAEFYTATRPGEFHDWLVFHKPSS